MIFAWQSAAWATIIAEDGRGDVTRTVFAEEVITGTQVGIFAGSYDNLSFSFYTDHYRTTASAAGYLYLLSQKYFGPPTSLISELPGFIAKSALASGGVWTFDPSVTVQVGTTYALITDSTIAVGTSFESFYFLPDPNLYFTDDAASNFGDFADYPRVGFGSDFVFSGTLVSTTPEPTSVLSACTGLLCTWYTVRRRLRHSSKDRRLL